MARTSRAGWGDLFARQLTGLEVADERARALRKRLTPQEVKLWQALRRLRPLGHHFRRQSPIGDFVVDFECRRARLVLEVDGGQHAVSRTDAARDAALVAAGYEVFRVWNCDVDESLEGVVETILQRIHQRRREST